MTASYSSLTANALAADARSLDALKLKAASDSPQAIKEAAKQFESLFMRELIKSMREATMKSGMLDSAGGDLGTDMLDQQLAVQMSGMPGGLSDLIAKQLARQTLNPQGQLPGTSLPAGKDGGADSGLGKMLPPLSSTALPRGGGTAQSNFVQRHAVAAERVARESGLPSGYMLGQAGHETGWGRSEIRRAGGAASHNLFGIKAGAGWTGKVASVTTTEYVDGQPRKVVAKFRAYDSYEDSFRDYARLITESPRYAQASQQTASAQSYANGLQRAGYATDPDYANKLSRAINMTLQLQRAHAAGSNGGAGTMA